jgi:hypothetical protein
MSVPSSNPAFPANATLLGRIADALGLEAAALPKKP